MKQTRLSLAAIRTARSLIDPIFLDTPYYPCAALGAVLGCELSIKLETANPVRSFKGRGTEVAIHRLLAAGRQEVICASAGNLGQALAFSGVPRGVDVSVVASRFAPVMKLDRIRALGAGLELVDGDHEVARERAAQRATERGIRLLEDSLDVETCEGAGTMALEIIESLVPPDVVLVALGGGALATGVAQVIAEAAPGIEVICVQPAQAPAMTLSWRAGRVVSTETADTIADGVAGRFPIAVVLNDLLQLVDDAVLVSEQSIITAIRLLLEHAGLVVEPSAALGVAAILENRERFAGRRVATLICGSNVDPDQYRRWVDPRA